MRSNIVCLKAVFIWGVFTCTSSFLIHRTSRHKSNASRSQQRVSKSSAASIESIKDEIRKAIAPTERGLKCTKEEQEQIDKLLRKLEDSCQLLEPARSPYMAGNWLVEYSTSPPPSNGKLGPFVGEARQIIDLKNKSYINFLSVDPASWLTAQLSARWEEWDGILLDDNETTSSDIESNRGDFGASSWKVEFLKLEIKLFSNTVFEKSFKNTARVWKMTYVDELSRIVRAGRTGKDEDDVVFFMSREEQLL